ncbi:MAG TPA: ABC transporter substrate-binding protein, partial [Solirubrobacteraceae bacterium]|nr:ABC transporter substrate-binding protein [Solirubrobacteraceae bacterium]
IDPETTADVNAMFMVGLANAQLVIENTSGKLEPQLASSWAASRNGLKWTFQLRASDRFSNGKTVTPADVVSTFQNIIAAKSQSPAKSSFAGILKSIKAGKGDSVVFNLDKPYADFPYLLTGANTNVLPAGFDAATWVHNPVGAGEFILKKYTPGQGATFVKNPYYWDASAVKLAGVDVSFFSSTSSEVASFQSGAIDQINPVDAGGSVLSAVKSTPHRTETAGYAKFDGIVFNVKQAPFNNVDVRRAIAWALNRKQIVNTIYGGDATIGNDIATFPDYAFQPKGITQRSQNLAKVNQLVAASGLPKPITFQITTYTGESPLAQLIQQELQATGDFSVTINAEPESQYYGGSNATTPWLNAPLTITDWADRLPAQLEGLIYAQGAVWNASKFSNPTLDKLAAEDEETTNAAKRQSIENQIASIEWNDVPVIIAAFQKNTLILSPKVQGNFTNGQNFDGGFDFRGISLK